jgi:hypothetical protein
MRMIFFGDYCVSKPRQPVLSSRLQERLCGADVIGVNFEGPLLATAVPAPKAASKAGPSLSQVLPASETLKHFGCTHAALANNHIMDYGETGLTQTMASLSQLGVAHFGAGESFDAAYAPHYSKIGEQTIAFCSFAEAQFGVLQEADADASGFAWMDHPKARQSVREAAEKADFVVVQVHGGLEMVEFPLPEWRRCYRELIDLGADMIIGHHPHVAQGHEMYRGKPIVYSLGNFYMDVMLAQKGPGHGLMLDVELSDGELTFNIVPLAVSHNEVDLDLSDHAAVSQRERDDLLKDEAAYTKAVDDICASSWETIYETYYAVSMLGLGGRLRVKSLPRWLRSLAVWLLKGRKGSVSRHLLLLHNIRIETHRWVVERAITRMKP